MVPFADLRAQNHQLREEIQDAVSRVLSSSQFILGDEVDAFEEEFASYVGASYGVGVNSGTSALHLALLAADVGPGDEVITVPFTFIATASAIEYTGARPVFVDIDPVSFTMDVDQIESVITERTKAILPVHLYGHPAEMDPILEIARRYNLVVIEDAAQAHGAKYKGQRVGTLGDLAAFSFYPGKNLGACGEGGMVVTSNSELARKVRMLRDWGAEKKYHHVLKGFNYRLEGLQGAILRLKLRRLDEWTNARRTNAALYDSLLEQAGCATPVAARYCKHVYHVYAIRVQDRAHVQAHLGKLGIQTGIHYPIPVHLQPAFADLGYEEGDFPESERAAREELSLPMFAELTAAQVHEVSHTVSEALNVTYV